MKKFLSVVIACILCVCALGCVSEEEKFLKKQDEWLANLSYDYFQLYRIDDVDGVGLNFGHGVASVIYDFCIKVQKEININTIKVDYDSEEALDLDIPAYAYPIAANRELSIAAAFGKEFLPKEAVPQNIPFTLHYTTTDGEEVSKDYILDFTQKPFRDYRDK